MSLSKPPHGQPCNNCGLCCANQPCPLGARLFRKTSGACPALEKDGDKYYCGLAVNPKKYLAGVFSEAKAHELSHGAKLMIGSGIGCDAQLEGETHNTTMKQRFADYVKNNSVALQRAKIVWGIR
jgi:hypothetical protein